VVNVCKFFFVIFSDPDLFIHNENILPNNTYYKWKSERYGSDLINIPHVQANIIGMYLIGVYSSSNSTYTITSILQDDTTPAIVSIHDGQPQSALLTAGHMNYYLLEVTEVTSELTIAITTRFG
jgi:hypothetical protein